jgi:hypothetical protein
VGRSWLKANMQRKSDGAGRETFADARRRKESALADLRELEARQQSGELVRVADVEER